MSSGYLPTVKRAMVAIVLALTLLWPAAAATRSVWMRAGIDGGTVIALAIDPQTPTTLYAGTQFGGVFKSVDGGESWQTVNDGLPEGGIRQGNPRSPCFVQPPPGRHILALAIDPQVPTIVYAATGARDIFKSTNGGTSWSGVYVGEMMGQITSLVIDPKTPTTLYAAVGCPPGLGVLKSTDGGQSWHPVNTGLTFGVTVLTVDPRTPSTLYAGTAMGVFKTTNGGDNWHAASAGLADVWPTHVSVTALVINPRAPTNIFAVVAKPTGVPAPEPDQNVPWFDRSTQPPPSTARIYESVDGGGNWRSVTTLGFTVPDVRALAINPQTPSTLYAAVGPFGVDEGVRVGLYKSTDRGRNWRPLNTGLAGAARALAVDSQRPDTVYASIGAGGVFKTNDGGERWRAVNAGLTGLDLYTSALAIDPKTPTIVYAGTAGGVFKSTDGGTSWRRPNNTLLGPVRVLAVDPNTPTTIYAGTPSHGVVKSTDGGGSWRAINAGLGNVTRFWVSGLVIDPGNPSTIYMSWSDPNWGVPSAVYKSTDAGGSWTVFNNGLPDKCLPDRCQVLGLAIAPSAPTTVYLSLLGPGIYGIYKTTNGTGMWTHIGQPPAAGSSIVVDPRTSDTIYVSSPYYSHLPTGADIFTGAGIFKSTDGGRSWRAINTGLTNLHVQAIAIDSQTPTTLYVGTEEWPGQPHGGVFVSTDGGDSWHPMNDGLTDLYVYALVVDPKTPSTIYAVTRDGVFVLRQ